jgi:hypothetical protein
MACNGPWFKKSQISPHLRAGERTQSHQTAGEKDLADGHRVGLARVL